MVVSVVTTRFKSISVAIEMNYGYGYINCEEGGKAIFLRRPKSLLNLPNVEQKQWTWERERKIKFVYSFKQTPTNTISNSKTSYDDTTTKQTHSYHFLFVNQLINLSIACKAEQSQLVECYAIDSKSYRRYAKLATSSAKVDSRKVWLAGWLAGTCTYTMGLKQFSDTLVVNITTNSTNLHHPPAR